MDLTGVGDRNLAARHVDDVVPKDTVSVVRTILAVRDHGDQASQDETRGQPTSPSKLGHETPFPAIWLTAIARPRLVTDHAGDDDSGAPGPEDRARRRQL